MQTSTQEESNQLFRNRYHFTLITVSNKLEFSWIVWIGWIWKLHLCDPLLRQCTWCTGYIRCRHSEIYTYMLSWGCLNDYKDTGGCTLISTTTKLNIIYQISYSYSNCKIKIGSIHKTYFPNTLMQFLLLNRW